MRIERNCPLPQTHNRLRQTHDLWHDVANAYPDADAFVLALNNCISTARSVTFVLQTEGRRRNREQFDPWYERRREAMTADSRMKWLSDARTDIQKKGDLDTHSVARVSLLTTDAEFQLADLEVAPLLSPDDVVQTVKVKEMPERIRKQAVLVVERRWTVPELPGDELLDTLGHCYGRLADVVREAHELFGVEMQTFGGETHGGRHQREPHPSGRLPCMLPTTEMRTAYWHLGAETLVQQEIRAEEKLSADDQKEMRRQAKERYDFNRHRLLPGAPMVDQAGAFHRVARHFLATDGYHLTLAWLFNEGEPVGQYQMTPDDHQDKILKIRTLAQVVERKAADAAVVTTETWEAQPVDADDDRFLLRATEREDRTEALQTVLLQRDGNHHLFHSPFTRDEEQGSPANLPDDWAPAGAIVLGAVQDQPLDHYPLFAPVLAVWERWNAAG